MTEIRELAKFVCKLQWEDAPETVRRAAVNVVFDSVGCGIGACRNPQILNVIREFSTIDEGEHSVSLWGQGQKRSLETAIFINAMQGHTLELDDVHTRSKTHIGTVVVPAAWAVAEFFGKSGKELLLAVLCGYEVVARIGMALGVSAHRNLGWHATSTAGIYGAAAACGKLMGLSEEQLVNAMGMAGEEAGGTWAFLGDGASCKVLNPAMAAVNGAKCALLAKAGMTGPEHVLTVADGGMLAAMSNQYDVSLAAKGLGKDWEILNMDNKPYPCCRSTHCVIDGVLALRKRHEIPPEQVEQIEVHTYLVGNKQCGMSAGSRRPSLPVEAKFSSPYTAAVALMHGSVELKDFEPEAILEPRVQQLLSKVQVITDEVFTARYPNHWGCRVTIRLTDGQTYESIISDASGSVDNPLSREQLVQKISGVLRGVMDEAQAEKTVKGLWELETAEILPVV